MWPAEYYEPETKEIISDFFALNKIRHLQLRLLSLKQNTKYYLMSLLH